MKKKIIATLICTAMLLSACGNKVEPMPQKAEVSEIHVDDGKVTDNSGTDAFDASIKYSLRTKSTESENEFPFKYSFEIQHALEFDLYFLQSFTSSSDSFIGSILSITATWKAMT